MMKCFKNSMISVLAVCMVLALSACGSLRVKLNPSVVADDTAVSAELSPNTKQMSVFPQQIGVDESTSSRYRMEFTEVARNSNSILYADMKKGHFALQDINTGKIWYSTPNDAEADTVTSGTDRMEIRSQLLAYYVLRTEENTVSNYKVETSQSGCINKGGITVERIDRGIRVTYEFKKLEVTVPVLYQLTEDSFEATVLVDQIKEGKKVFLIGLNLLPTFGAAGDRENGYLFVPDGSGALIDFALHRNMDTPYNRPLYGKEKAVAQKANKLKFESLQMPVFGTVVGESTLMGVIDSGDSVASVSAMYRSDTIGYNGVSAVMNYRTIDSKEMYSKQGGINSTLNRVSRIHTGIPKFNVSYYLLSGKDSGYVGMADRYRTLLEKNGLLHSAVKEPSLNLEVYGTFRLNETFLGMKYSTTEVLTTFAEAKEIVSDLKQSGVENITLRYRGLAKGGVFNDKVVTSFSPVRKIGSKAEYDALCKEAEIYPDFDLQQFQSSGNGISLSEDAVRTVFDYKSEQNRFSRSVFNKIDDEISYLLRPEAILGAGRTLLGSLEKASVKNVSFSSLGSCLYSNFASDGGMYRDGMNAYVTALLGEYRQKDRQIAVENAGAFALAYTDKIWSAPMYSCGYDIFKTDVPFYQIVLHGSIPMTTPCVIQSQDPAVTVLKAVETGSELLFGCTYEDSTVLIGSRFEELYSTEYRAWKDYAVKAAAEYQPLLQKIYDRKIVSHREVADGVFETVFENGTGVLVNYSEKDYTDACGNTAKAMAYTEMNGGGSND